MSSIFALGQTLRGRLGKYVITKEIQNGVWSARWANGLKSGFLSSHLTSNRNWLNDSVIIKSVADHPRVENERDVLRLFQHWTPHLRPLIDEIIEPSNPTAIVLKYLEDNLLGASVKQTLNRKELKYVSKCLLKALIVLHEDGYVHAGTIISR